MIPPQLCRFLKKTALLTSVGLFSTSINCTQQIQMEKFEGNEYVLNMNDIKVYSKEKWDINYAPESHKSKIFNFLAVKTLVDSNLVAIVGNKKNEDLLEIRFFPKNLFDPYKYQLQKELYDTTQNPFLINEIEFSKDLEGIQADSIYRMRFSVNDITKKSRGICWELRFYKDIIQSVYFYTNSNPNPPLNNSEIYKITSDVTFSATSNEQYNLLLKRAKSLYKQVEAGIKNSNNIGLPEMIHTQLLILFLNRH